MDSCTVVHFYLGLADPSAAPVPRFDLLSRRLSKSAPDGTPLSVPEAPFDILLELRLPGLPPTWTPEAQVAVVRTVATVSGLDPRRSVVLAGTEYAVIPGAGSAFSAGMIRRRPEINRDTFVRHWSERHSVFARRVGGTAGYRQLHAVPEFSAAVAACIGIADAGYDGVGMMLVADAADLSKVRAAPQVSRDATRDELRFVDHSRSFFFAVEAVM